MVVQHVVAPALVLGSTQPAADVDAVRAAAAGFEVARRRSGGGAVLLRPDDHVWVDLVVPAGDPLADPDVERATWWVGDAWIRALGLDGGGPGGAAVVHRSGVSDRSAGRVACFAALGPGELSIDGRKVLGVSQRRTRDGARFQCVAYRTWEPARLLDLLAVTGAVQTALVDRAGAVVAPGWDVVERLLPVLP